MTFLFFLQVVTVSTPFCITLTIYELEIDFAWAKI